MLDPLGNEIQTPAQILRASRDKEAAKAQNKQKKMERQNLNRRTKRIELRFIEKMKRIKASRASGSGS